MSDTVRKRASELKVGDEVVGYGVLAHWYHFHDEAVQVAAGTSGYSVWPSDAEVTVKVKPRKWQRTVVETTEREQVAKNWRAQKVHESYDMGTHREYGEVVEL